LAVSVNEALKLICENIVPVSSEIVSIENALGCISAKQIFATHFLPRFNNSAMDGYAVHCSNVSKQVKIIGKILAGDNKNIKIQQNETIKITTGARVPDSADAIVPQELVEEIDENHIKLPEDIKKHQHIRFIGEDIKLGELLIDIGDKINSATITLLASQGITHIKVYKKPSIAVFASGKELKLHFEDIEPHQIYNSNTPTLLSRVKELGCNANFVGMAKDSTQSIKEHITAALGYDLIITSGGVSVGEADFTKEAFNQLGFETIFSQIMIKPGKPTVFGKIGNTYVLNLPGNPLASSLIFELFGKILVQKLIGSNQIYHNTIIAKIGEDLKNKKGRVTLIPGFFDGENFIPSQKRSPGMVSALNNCNCLIAVDEDVEILKQNDEVKILPINWKFFAKKEKDFLTRIYN